MSTKTFDCLFMGKNRGKKRLLRKRGRTTVHRCVTYFNPLWTCQAWRGNQVELFASCNESAWVDWLLAYTCKVLFVTAWENIEEKEKMLHFPQCFQQLFRCMMHWNDCCWLSVYIRCLRAAVYSVLISVWRRTLYFARLHIKTQRKQGLDYPVAPIAQVVELETDRHQISWH